MRLTSFTVPLSFIFIAAVTTPAGAQDGMTKLNLVQDVAGAGSSARHQPVIHLHAGGYTGFNAIFEGNQVSEATFGGFGGGEIDTGESTGVVTVLSLVVLRFSQRPPLSHIWAAESHVDRSRSSQ